MVASNFGQAAHPSWSTNLLHDPHAHVTWRGKRQPVKARLLTTAEKASQRQRILSALPVYDTYAARSGRDIRVFHLAPDTSECAKQGDAHFGLGVG